MSYFFLKHSLAQNAPGILSHGLNNLHWEIILVVVAIVVVVGLVVVTLIVVGRCVVIGSGSGFCLGTQHNLQGILHPKSVLA